METKEPDCQRKKEKKEGKEVTSRLPEQILKGNEKKMEENPVVLFAIDTFH